MRGGNKVQIKNSALKILDAAISSKSSDIYFLPYKGGYEIKFFASGKYYLYIHLSFEEADKCINYFKFKANMNISEKRRPQLGAWRYAVDSKVVNCRFSSVGNFMLKESLVIRLIYQIDDLEKQRYFIPSQWKKIEKTCLKRGLILFSGPTGSGKTTSMYELIKKYSEKQILCIEDPVEIFQPNVLQLQVNEDAGITYEHLAKVALRHHPEILVIGEIRDCFTAKIVIQAALSGHLVLSTVHASDANGVVARLLNLGVNEVDLSQTLKMVNYQRLISDTNNEIKVLFDQIDFDETTLEECLNQKNISKEWQSNLEKFKEESKISTETFQKYYWG